MYFIVILYMAGLNYTGSRMKRLPHALFGHTVDEKGVV